MFYEMVIKNPSKFTLFLKHQDREKYKKVAQNEKKLVHRISKIINK